MTDELISHEDIERGFKVPIEVLARLPDTIESREARRHIDIAQKLTHEVRERTRPEPAE